MSEPLDTAPEKSQQHVLQEALQIIQGDRRNAYGNAKDSFDRVATGWSEILKTKVTGPQVALCMIWLKICRESNKHHRDNIVDIAGYAALIDEIK